MTPSENECREAFESFMSNRRMSLDKGEDGYEDGFTDWNWTVWQAAWKARSQDAQDARRYKTLRNDQAGIFTIYWREEDGTINEHDAISISACQRFDQAIDAAMSK